MSQNIVTVTAPHGPVSVAVAGDGGAACVAARALAAVGHPSPASAVAAGTWTLTPPCSSAVLPSFLALTPARALAGGKGGFGSLLRAQGRVAKTTNFDACRDLSGRRIRQVKAEAALADWEAPEQERALEAVAEKHLRTTVKAAKAAAKAAAADVEVDGDAVRAEQEAAAAAAKAAVADSLKGGGGDAGAGGGDAAAPAQPAPDAKQKKQVNTKLDAMMGLSDGGDSSSDSE